MTRFEARFNSPLLSDIVRGLIGVLRGDNGINYFQMLSHDMKQLEASATQGEGHEDPAQDPSVLFRPAHVFPGDLSGHHHL